MSKNYSKRKDTYCNKVLGEFEAYTYRSMEDWDEEKFADAFDLLNAVENEVKCAYSQYKEESKESEGERDCVICGRRTKGSIGKAGIHWKMICQDCKDKADDDYLASLKPIVKLINGLDELLDFGTEDKL